MGKGLKKTHSAFYKYLFTVTTFSKILALSLFIALPILGFYLGMTYSGKSLVPSSSKIIGGDKDTHGCLTGAGYSWCEEKNKCLRVWEEYCTKASPTTAIFTCSDSKSITATFYPMDDKFVDLILSDDRKLSVPHTMSGSGARYAKSDDSFVFWNKGNTAFITENEKTTFENCVTSN